jgi:sterol desaturase/sphingolipid hydroxylase (fatty acid hydroxylase superfamily)
MHLSRTWYYADFYVYPVVATGLAAHAVAELPARGVAGWAAWAVVGLALWTLVEYGMHRIVFHHIAGFERMHDVHHHSPVEMIGTPVWLSGAAILAVLLPLWLAFGERFASGHGTGVIVGYLWYMVVHHATHHWTVDHRSYFYAAKRRHALHHHVCPDQNFGVTTDFWDMVFGTAFRSRDKPSARQA